LVASAARTTVLIPNTELDIYIPSCGLAFEYQGHQHFYWNSKCGGLQSQKLRDLQKRNTCEQLGISLIQLPFWWDLKADTLTSLVHQIRPDLVCSGSLSALLQPPIPGNVMLRVGFLSAQQWIDVPAVGH